MKFPNADSSLQMADSLIKNLSEFSMEADIDPANLGYYNRYVEPQTLKEQFPSAP